MKETKRTKKKRSAGSRKPTSVGTNATAIKQEHASKGEEKKGVETLVEAFSSVSAASDNECLNGDAKAAAEIWAKFLDGSEYSSSGVSSSSTSGDSASTSWSLGTGSSEGIMESGRLQDVKINGKGGRKLKKVASSGSVSAVLGKDYVGASPGRKLNGLRNQDELMWKENAAQFLYSMLGDKCELSMDVIRDVLCQCGYNVEKALDVLFDLSASPDEHSTVETVVTKGNTSSLGNGFYNQHTNEGSYCTSFSSEHEFQADSRNYLKVLTGLEPPPPSSIRSNMSDLPQRVLESLFNISKSEEHVPSSMNWRQVVEKMKSLGPRIDVGPSNTTLPRQESFAKGDDYHVLREGAKQRWDSMRSYYQKAATAYSDGKREYATYLSNQGKLQTKLAREADEKASHDIFKSRNKGMENVISLDLHGQHVKPAMKLLKLHLVLGTYVPSVKALRVITGCGSSNALGKSKVKQSVVKLLESEGIEWSEENQGTLIIKVGGYRELNFLNSESDTD